MSAPELVSSWAGPVLLWTLVASLVVFLVVACVLAVDWTVRELRRRAGSK